TDGKKADKAVKLIRREIDKLMQKPISATELARAKSQAKGSIMLGLENMSSRMMRIGRQELYYGRYFSLDEILELIDGVSALDLQEAAALVCAPEQFSDVRLLPE
ncbi:MAG: insulinase family protein, partial [Bacteroidetes bacterium]|nr:insulinase family protein [Bacteroidota bacterium]